MWVYRLFRRDPASPRTPDEWVDALVADGWEVWAPGRGAWMTLHGQQVYTVQLRREAPQRQGAALPSPHDDNDSR